jgi:uncharacterized cysteine cluster protein YcgN (CxxCxxCC family)
MSGGSYDYVFGRIADIELRDTAENPRRATFQKLLKLVAKAMHDIEWVDSCDYGDGGENQAIDDCFAFLCADPETIKKAHAFDSLKERLQEYFK